MEEPMMVKKVVEELMQIAGWEMSLACPKRIIVSQAIWKEELAAIIKISSKPGFNGAWLCNNRKCHDRHIYELLHHFYEGQMIFKPPPNQFGKTCLHSNFFWMKSVEEILLTYILSKMPFGIETGIDAVF